MVEKWGFPCMHVGLGWNDDYLQVVCFGCQIMHEDMWVPFLDMHDDKFCNSHALNKI